MRNIFIAAVAFAMMSGAASAATQPMAGTYYMQGSNSSSGAGCTTLTTDWIGAVTANGYNYSGFFYYPGPNKTGATTTYTTNGRTGYDTAEFAVAWPAMPAAGATSWSGNFTITAVNWNGYLANVTYSGTVSTTFYFITARQFGAQRNMVLTNPDGSGTCSITAYDFYTRTGN